MAQESIRIGIVGTGLMGLEHIRSLQLSPEAQIVAIADPVPLSQRWARDELGARAAKLAVYPDIRSMLAGSALDAVIIASPNHTHYEVLMAALETDLHILCEKPLCSRVEDAARIVAKAKGHRGVFWVGMEYRFMPPAAAFIEAVQSGRVGRLIMLSMREHRFPFLAKVGDWNRFSRNTGGTMVEKCCHFFDLMRHIVRAEAVRVYCSGAMDVNHLDERYGGEMPDILDNSYTIVDFANGARAMLDLSMFAEGSERQEEIAAIGDSAKLEVFIPPGELVFSPRVPLGAAKAIERQLIVVDAEAMAAGSHFGATYFQHRAFLAAISGTGPVQITAEDGYRAMAIGAGAERSAREHRVVEMHEIMGVE